MTPEKIDTITDAAFANRILAAAIEAKFVEERSLQRLNEQFALSGFSGYASLTFKKGRAECTASFDDAPPPDRSTTANLYRDKNDNLMDRKILSTQLTCLSFSQTYLSLQKNLVSRALSRSCCRREKSV